MTCDLGHETKITSQKKNKKMTIFNWVKMSKSTTLIMRPRYFHIKQIKTDYKTQFPTDSMLNNKIKKNQLKKGHKK